MSVSRPADNFGYIFAPSVAARPLSPAVIQDDRILTYADLDQRCNRIAHGLLSRGLKPGDRVALLFGNHWRYIECFFGPMRAGLVTTPLNTRMSDAVLADILAECSPRAILVSEDQRGRADALRRKIGSDTIWILDEGEQDQSLSALAEAGHDGPPEIEAGGKDVCLLLYTSGSTGRPKGVLLQHGGQIWNAQVVAQALAIRPDERALVAVPLFHKNAMTAAVKPFLVCGGSLVILPGFNPEAVIRAIERHKATYMTGVPAMYKMILECKDLLAAHDTSSMNYILCGSAEVSEELLQAITAQFNAKVMEGYGLTEGGPVPLISERHGEYRRGSCGRAIAGCDVRLVDQSGDDIEGVGVGELVVRNPGLAVNYVHRPQDYAKKFRDGWLYTGDLMRRDADGYFYFVGRTDDMMQVSGENVYPKEVENILIAHPAVYDVCVVAAAHPVKGQVPVAFVVADGKASLTEKAVQDFYLQKGTPYAYPRRVIFMQALPLKSTGKVDRQALTAQANLIINADLSQMQ